MNLHETPRSDWTRQDAWFPSGCSKCAAWVYRPKAAAGMARPCVVMAHGFAGTRIMCLDRYAARFADAGYVVVLFDYRHFGDSEGEPRQLLSIRKQLEDWQAAVKFARELEDIRPECVALWGTSLAGGHAIATGISDSRIAAVIAQVPHVSGPLTALATGPNMLVPYAVAITKDLVRAARGRAPFCIPTVGKPGTVAAMTADGALEAMRRMVPSGHVVSEEVSARVLLDLATYSPARKVARLQCPLLVQVGSLDRVTPPKPARRAAWRARRGELIEYPVGHFDVYFGGEFERAIVDQLMFLSHHLPVSGRAPS